MATISKTDYMLWRDCPKNAWIRIHKPEIFYASEITEFDQSMIESGIEVEDVARRLFPSGVLVASRDEEALRTTQKYLAAKTPILFQPIFEQNGFLAAVDVLELNGKTGGYSIHEIKSSTKLKPEHLYDVAFQALLLRQTGLNIERIFMVHLNPQYVRQGDLDLASLFVVVDMTVLVDEVSQTAAHEMDEARTYLLSTVEPSGPCRCIYRGRSRHCSTFAYSNPQVPEYSVHDISRIGSSPKKLKEMIDAGIFSLESIPIHIQLSDIQQEQIRTHNSGKTVIRKKEIASELQSLKFPLHFIDYETHLAAIPLFDGYSPHDNIPFQYSLHTVKSPGEEPIHKEFLHIASEDPSELLVKSLQENIGPTGSIIVWHKTFESGINNDLPRRIPAAEEFMANLNSRIYDLKDIFSKQFYVHRSFLGKVSIKKILPVLAAHLSYSSLEIQEGGTASLVWSKIVSGRISEEESNRLREAIKKYCAMDSYGMYAIWRALCEIAPA